MLRWSEVVFLINELTTDVVVELKFDKVLSVIDIDYDKFSKWENTMPFY